DRWSNPSGSIGQHRFRVWPAGPDSYDHTELTANWDHLDGILGAPPSGMWPPTEGINGGIYKLIKDLQTVGLTLADISAVGPFASRGNATDLGLTPKRQAGFFYLATDRVGDQVVTLGTGGTLYRSNGVTWDTIMTLGTTIVD